LAKCHRVFDNTRFFWFDVFCFINPDFTLFMPVNQISPKSLPKSTETIAVLPPAELEAEKSILGSILINNKNLEEVADKIRPEYFYDARHSIIYKVMVELWSANRPVDIIFLLENQQIKAYSDIDKDYLLELISKSSLSSSPSHTASIIREKYILRSLVSIGDKIKSMALEQNSEATEILDQAQKQIYQISMDNIEKNFVSLTDILTEAFERINQLYNNKVQFRGLPTGFVDLDMILGGLHPSDLVILAARPSMGKTSLALEMIKRIALYQKVGVAVFSLEMSRDQLCDKLISSVSGINLSKIRSGHLSDEPDNNEFMRLGAAIGQLDQAPIWIDDSGYLSILELRTKARRLKTRHNIGLLVIDYLQLMSGGSTNYGGNRVQEVSDISRGLKMLAKELNIPILALSQLSRSVEGREDKRPMLSDLRESGSIEQDADVVLFVHREEMYHKDTKKKGIADILISKHRNGETGAVELAWVHRLATFDNLEGARQSHKRIE
jgi:replicative DNA helicase